MVYTIKRAISDRMMEKTIKKALAMIGVFMAKALYIIYRLDAPSLKAGVNAILSRRKRSLSMKISSSSGSNFSLFTLHTSTPLSACFSLFT
jgi:hypothetical protein